MKRILSYLIPVVLCFAVGFTASLFQAQALENWYPLLDKSPLNPPDIAFPIAWSILYLCMGFSIGIIIDAGRQDRGYFISLFAVQLFFNFMWSILFFYFRNPLLGFVNICILEILIIFYAVRAYPAYRTSALLFVPYSVWVGFAAYLNLYILANN